MMMTLLMMVLTLMIMLILLITLNLFSKKTFYDKEKNSPFECGFDPKNNSRLPFSIQFFLIAMIFLIFDVEIILIIPMMKIMESSQLIDLMITMNMFFIILILGIYHEWNQGALSWLK